MARTSLLDVSRIYANGKYNNSTLAADAYLAVIEESLKAAPEARLIPFEQIGSTDFRATIRNGLPSVGWRKANQGVAPSRSKFDERLFQTKILSARIECDLAVANSRSGGRGNLVALETIGTLEAAFRELGETFYYGEANGLDFPGLVHLYQADEMTVDAEGTGNERSSVWFVKTGERDVRFLLGGDLPLALSEFREESVTDSEGKKFPALVSDMTAWVGLQQLSRYSVARIANLTAAKPLDDDMGFEALMRFPAERLPDLCLMNKRSLAQLRESRKTPENPNPGVPTELAGIPIRVTDSISNAESN